MSKKSRACAEEICSKTGVMYERAVKMAEIIESHFPTKWIKGPPPKPGAFWIKYYGKDEDGVTPITGVDLVFEPLEFTGVDEHCPISEVEE